MLTLLYILNNIWKKHNEIQLTKKWTWTIKKSKIINLPSPNFVDKERPNQHQ